ncbi:MAG: hypothetical protein MJY78_08740 [Fibrobacter sp.]|nr:hypothetical protein [Fibrobacter sp.]
MSIKNLGIALLVFALWGLAACGDDSSSSLNKETADENQESDSGDDVDAPPGNLLGMANSAGPLWNMHVNAYQVQVPEAVECSMANDDASLCYEITGGWWFAYVGDDADGQTMSFSPIDYNPNGTYKLITTDEFDGSIIPGGNLDEDRGLVVTMAAGEGKTSTPAIAGVGFNWTKDGLPIDISGHSGFYIKYSWTGSSPLQMELGWDDSVCGTNSWYAKLPAKREPAVLELPWAEFKQDGQGQTIDVAQTQAVSLKIRLKVVSAAEVKGDLAIVELGWLENAP